MRHFLIVLCTLFFVLGCWAQRSRGVVSGSVVNGETKEKVAGANVSVVGTVLGTTTNSEGEFILSNLDSKSYSLVVSMIGYQRRVIADVVVKESETTSLTIELEPLPVQTQPVVVTASKREQSIIEIPVALSVVDEKLLTQRNSVAVDDALRYVPGVSFVQSQVNIRGSTGYSKGVGTRVLLLVDGLPMLSGDTGEIIWESFPVNQIERIEIVKGAGSALFGSSALGGVINIITKSASETPETRLQLYGGMYDSPYYSEWKWSNKTQFVNGIRLSHQRKINNVSVLLVANRTEDDGYQMNNHWTRWNGWFKVGVETSPFESFTFSGSALDQRRGNFLYWKNLDSALVPPVSQLDDRVESFRWNLGASYKRILSTETYLTFKSSLFNTRWEDNIANLYDTKGNRSTSKALNFEGQLVHQISSSNILTGGVYTNFNSVDADTIFGKHSSTCIAGYVQDELTIISKIHLTLGGRFDYHKLEGTESEHHFNPKFGLTYNPNEGMNLRFAIGRGFRAPSVAETFSTTEAAGVSVIPNPLLHSEQSWSYEVGGTQIIGNNLLAEISLFRNEFWDLIEPTFNTSGQVQFQNITRARIQGVELNLKSSWFDGFLTGDLGYTYIYPEDISKNDLLKYRPRHLLYVNGNISIKPVQLGIDFRFISKADRIDEEFAVLGIIRQGEKRVPAFVTDLHLNTDWRFTGLPLSSSFHVNNLFNYNYVELIGNIAPIRNFVLTMEGTW